MTSEPLSRGRGRPPSIDDPQKTISDVAAALFSVKGYEGTSLQDVADAVGFTKAGLYHYYPSKPKLFESIVLGTLADMLHQAERAVAAQSGVKGKLKAFMMAHAEYFDQNRDRYRASFFGRAGWERADFKPDELAARRAYMHLLQNILETGGDELSLDAKDIATAARGILGMLNWMARWYRPEGPKTATEIAEFYAEMLLNGLSKH